MIPYYRRVPFSDAIPVNSSFDRVPNFNASKKRESGRHWDRTQSVNISQATVDRLARERLKEAILSKLSYSQRGVLGSEETIGQNISAKA